MGLLQTLGTGQGYLKAGFLGFPKSGKTYTATLLACGVRAAMHLDGPLVMFDTEGGSEYIAPLVKQRTGRDLVGVRSRSFDDMLTAAKEAQAMGASVFLADSMTHVWRELCDSYLERINATLKARGRSTRSRLEFQDWNPIKAKWATWTDFYLNSPMHIIICGRAGFDYDYEEREDGGKDLVKTGIKMKTEGEFGFEPSLLVQMERTQTLDKGRATLVHTATVLGDRFNVIDAQSCDNPGYDFFAPHVALLTPGAVASINTATLSQHDVSDEGDAAWNRERRQRAIFSEEIQGELMTRWPGQTAVEKKAKADALFQFFGTRSWTKVETMDSRAQEAALRAMREAWQAQDTGTAAFGVVEHNDAAGDAAPALTEGV